MMVHSHLVPLWRLPTTYGDCTMSTWHNSSSYGTPSYNTSASSKLYPPAMLSNLSRIEPLLNPPSLVIPLQHSLISIHKIQISPLRHKCNRYKRSNNNSNSRICFNKHSSRIRYFHQQYLLNSSNLLPRILARLLSNNGSISSMCVERHPQPRAEREVLQVVPTWRFLLLPCPPNSPPFCTWAKWLKYCCGRDVGCSGSSTAVFSAAATVHRRSGIHAACCSVAEG